MIINNGIINQLNNSLSLNNINTFYNDIYASNNIFVSNIITSNLTVNSNSRFLNKLGDYSYSIYLIHPIVIFILPEILFKLKVYNLFSNEIIFLMIFFFTIIISHFSFKFIEKGVFNFFINKNR